MWLPEVAANLAPAAFRAPPTAWSAFASSVMLAWALPDIGCIAWAIFAPSAISCAQFFVDANDGLTFDVDSLVVVAAVVVGDADFLADPPQAVTTTRRTTARERHVHESHRPIPFLAPVRRS